MNSYHQLLNKYRHLCSEKSIPEETARLFLFELCNEDHINLYTELDHEADLKIADRYIMGMARILNYEPMAHVLGYSYFYDYKFKVNGDVLIPRYETEELVMNILMDLDNYFGDYQTIKAVDIGTGSGAIAISLVKENPKIKMVATDISDKALLVARDNAQLNDVEMEFLLGDMLKPLMAAELKFDLLVSNPPYIPSGEVLETSVKDFEPHVALFGGCDGLNYYRQILSECANVLNDHALIAFEIGFDQKERIQELIREYLPGSEYMCYQDINGKDRMMIIHYHRKD